MFPSMYPTSLASAVAVLFALSFTPAARSADPAPATQPGDGPVSASAPLTPCLAVHADGSPVAPIKQLPSTKQITAAFKLKPDENGSKLTSRWISLAEGSDKTPIAENTLELKGRKAGWLRLTLKEPAPPGKYQLVALLDEKPWQTADIEIVPPVTDAKAEKPADLVPLKDDATMNYEMAVIPAKGTKTEIPGVTPGPDGSSRATMTMTYGKADDVGTPVALSINGKTLGEMWVKHDDTGLRAVRMKDGEKTKDVGHVIYPLPPKLEDGIEWTAKSKDGNEQKLQLFGPMMVMMDDARVPGFLVFSEEEITVGKPGEPATRGRETVVRSYIPEIGMVREERVAMLGGQVTGRNVLALETSKPYKIVANPKMKGRLGRVVFAFPKDSKAQSEVELYKAGDKKKINGGYGAADYEIMPGKYDASISNKRVPIEVKSAHDTILACGVLKINAGGNTAYKVLDADGKTQLASGYGAAEVALPIGTYKVDIGGGTEEVKIADGQVVEF